MIFNGGGVKVEVFRKKCKNLNQLINFFKSLKDSSTQVIQIFSSKAEITNKKIISEFKHQLPLSTLMGVTAAEVIHNNSINEDYIAVLAVNFEKSDFKLLTATGSGQENAAKIINAVEADTKAVIVFSVNNNTDEEIFINYLNGLNGIEANFVLAGGRAAAAAENERAHLFSQDGVIKKGKLILILNGKDLKAVGKHSMGWDSISREMEVTKSEEQVVYELDGRNIFQVYSEFLGEDIKDKLPSAAVTKFPLVFSRGFKNICSAVGSAGEGIRFSVNLKVGDKVKIAYGSLNKILSNSQQLQNNVHFHPEVSLIYSCIRRSSYLQSLNSSLIEEIQVVPNPKSGFATKGEYTVIDNKFQFLNVTTTVLYLSEKDESLSENIDFKTKKPELKTEHLFHLSQQVVSELENINDKMRKANQVTVDNKIEDTVANLFQIMLNGKNYTGGIVIKEAADMNKIYLDDSLGTNAYTVFENFWQEDIKKITIKENVLGFKKAFLIPLAEEINALMIILSDELDLYDIKKNHLFIKQIPNYLKKAILYESLQRNLASLSTLEQTSDFLYSTLNLDLLYERILDIVVGTMGMSAAVIFKKEKTELKMLKSINVKKETELFYYLRGFYNDIITSDEIIIKNRVDLPAKNETLIAIPINLTDFKGVLYAVQSKYKQLINENQKKFIRTLANQIRVSIRNALNHHKVKRLSVTDGLTNLYNHTYFHNQLQRKEGEKCSVAILDIDNFKDFNDTYGHQAGDEVLRQLSRVLESEIRDNDIVARYGGEEFVICLTVVDHKILQKIIKRLMNKIRELEINYKGQKMKITVSIGVAVNKKGEYPAEELIKNADTAMYIAKEEGKDRIEFYHEFEFNEMKSEIKNR